MLELRRSLTQTEAQLRAERNITVNADTLNYADCEDVLEPSAGLEPATWRVETACS